MPKCLSIYMAVVDMTDHFTPDKGSHVRSRKEQCCRRGLDKRLSQSGAAGLIIRKLVENTAATSKHPPALNLLVISFNADSIATAALPYGIQKSVAGKRRRNRLLIGERFKKT